MCCRSDSRRVVESVLDLVVETGLSHSKLHSRQVSLYIDKRGMPWNSDSINVGVSPIRLETHFHIRNAPLQVSVKYRSRNMAETIQPSPEKNSIPQIGFSLAYLITLVYRRFNPRASEFFPTKHLATPSTFQDCSKFISHTIVAVLAGGFICLIVYLNSHVRGKGSGSGRSGSRCRDKTDAEGAATARLQVRHTPRLAV